MPKRIAVLMAGAVLCAGSVCLAQSPTPAAGRPPTATARRDRSVGITDPNNYLRQRTARGTATPKPTAQPQAPAGSGETTPTAGRREARLGGAKPGGAATATAPAVAGHVKEVTQGMIEAIRTRKVEYNEEEMAEEPGVVILNSRKLQPGAPAILRKETGRAEEFGVPAKPL